MVETVREFVRQSFKLINPSNPTQPLHGDDQAQAILILNELLEYYASNGLLMPIAQTASINLTTGQEDVTVGPATALPVPNITLGRLAQYDSAWLLLSGVRYPLINMSRDVYLSSFAYEPLQGLPRFTILFPETDVVSIRLYPAPSQFFEFFLRAKFQFDRVTANSDMSLLPVYYSRFFKFAVAKDLALYLGRADAWTDRLEAAYIEAKLTIEAASEVNLSITGDRASILNGAWRTRAGV